MAGMLRTDRLHAIPPAPTIARALALRAAALLVLLPFAFGSSSPASAAGKPADRVRVRIEIANFEGTNFEATVSELELRGADIAAKDPRSGWIDVITTRGEIATLAPLGETRIVDLSRPFHEISDERRAAGGPLPEYKTYDEVVARLLAVEAAFPSIARVFDLTTDFGAPPTWGGRHLLAMKISDNVDLSEPEPAVLFDSLHHARELNTIEVSLNIIDSLTANYGVISRATTLVDSLEIWVVPVVNPDGLDYVWSNEQFWRKNRRDNGDGSFGVDLNRNYPFLWGACGSNSSDPSSDTYRGPFPTSEPEVQALITLAETIRPVVANSYHSSGREVLIPYVCADLAEASVINALRDIYRTPMDYDWRVASSSGESFEWMYNQTSSVAFLTEISTEFQPPFDETLDEVIRVRPGWITLLETILDGPVVSGVVTDSVSGLPVVAEIRADTVNFSEGERRASDAANGSYAWILQPGSHELTFSAPGYAPLTLTVEAILGGTQQDVELTPTAAAATTRSE